MNVLNTQNLLKMLWNSYYYILNSRKEYESDTLFLIHHSIERLIIEAQVSAANNYPPNGPISR